MKRLLIRADASLSMGTGHVMRCLALAQAWQDAGGVVTLAAAASLPVLLRERLVREGIDVATVQAVAGSLGDADWVLALHAELDAGWLVLDGYHFDDRYQASVRRVAGGLLVVDDLGHLPYYSADVVLNQNITANDELYPACAVTTLRLCGGTYGLLRREFRLPSQGLRQAHGRACRVLVTMGGADADNVTGKVVRALQAMEDIEARVLVGAVNPYLDELREMSAQSSGRISILTAVEAMVDLMDWAQAAVSAGGTSVLELASRMVPTLLITIADNQVAIAQALHERQMMKHLGWHQSLTSEAIATELEAFINDGAAVAVRSEQAMRAFALCDGQGASRVVQRMQALAQGHLPTYRELSLWPACVADSAAIYEWAQDPATRQASFNSAPIAWEDHCGWYARKLGDASSALWIGRSASGEKVGMVRLDGLGGEATISINLAPAQRGLGWGLKLVCAATQAALSLGLVTGIRAMIKCGNVASLRVFERAGFRPCHDASTPEGAVCLRLAGSNNSGLSPRLGG